MFLKIYSQIYDRPPEGDIRGRFPMDIPRMTGYGILESMVALDCMDDIRTDAFGRNGPKDDY